jgi:DNA-binding response OmpR family regulator
MDMVLGLRQGADDYVAKPFDAEVLVARMEALLRRAADLSVAQRQDSLPPPEVQRFGDFTLDRRRGELLRDSAAGPEPIALNAQEYRLLDFLAANHDRVIDRDEILDSVWDYGNDTTTRTVDVHVAKLRQRLGESLLPRHILTVRGRGYKFVG